MAVVSIATLKSYFQTGDFPTQLQFEDLIDTLDNASTSVYKKYVALVSQAGTAAPTSRILENTLGGTPVWARTGVGTYTLTLSNAWTANKTWAPNQVIYTNGVIVDIRITNANTITVVADGSGSDDVLSNTPIEIRVYP